MKRLLQVLAFALVAPVLAAGGVLSTAPLAARATTAVQAVRILNSAGAPVSGATVKIYVHGAPEIPGNVIATGTTDVQGYLSPSPTLTVGQQYDFTTSNVSVPNGSFTALGDVALTLIPGPTPETSTSGSVVIPAVGSTVSVPVADARAFPLGTYVVLADGTSSISGVVTSSGASSPLTIRNLVVTNGAVGDTIASGATLTFSGSLTGVEPAKSQTGICNVGDSIGQLVSNDNSTFATGALGNYPSRVVADLGPDYQMWNVGSPGATASDILTRILGTKANVLPKCDVVIIEDGTNDVSPLLPSGSVTSAYATYQTLLNDLVAAEPSTTKFVFVTVRQFGGSCSNISPCSAITAWNNAMKASATALAGTRSVSVLDLETDSTWYQSCGGTTPCWPDNVHPNQYAASLMGSMLATIITGLSPIRSAPGQSAVNGITVSSQATQAYPYAGSNVITADVGKNLVLQSGQCPLGAATACHTDIWLGGGNGNGGDVCVGDSRQNCLYLQTAGITIPQQYAGAPNPFIQTSQGAAGLDIYTPRINFPECGLVYFGTDAASSMAPNGTCGSQGTVWAGQIQIASATSAGIRVKDTRSGGADFTLAPGSTALGLPNQLLFYDGGSTLMASLGDNTTSGSFSLSKATAQFVAPNGFVAGTSGAYTPLALNFGTSSGTVSLFNVGSGSTVQGVVPSIWGFKYAGIPIFAQDGSGNVGIYGSVTAGAFSTSGLVTSVGLNAQTGNIKGSSDGATSSYVGPIYTNAGAMVATTAHTVIGTCSFSASVSCTAGFSGAAVFTSATSYSCSASSGAGTFADTGSLSVGSQTTNSIVITASTSNSQTVTYKCTGT